MDFIPLPLSGLVLIKPNIHQDNRGIFVKNYHRDLFLEHQIDFTPKEEFYTISGAGVLRGMHLQASFAELGKLVHCSKGQIYDVSLDLRNGSPTYGQAWGIKLDSVRRESIYLPPGFAHGFYTLEPDTIVHYSVSQVHAPLHDLGISWNSFDHDWPCADPILSDRDKSHPPLSDFLSPFQYK